MTALDRRPQAAQRPARDDAQTSHEPGTGLARALDLLPEPPGVRLRLHAALDALAASRLEREAIRLIDRGADPLTIDLRAVDDLEPWVPALLWAIYRYGRGKGSRVRVVLGETCAAHAAVRAGLLAGLIELQPSIGRSSTGPGESGGGTALLLLLS